MLLFGGSFRQFDETNDPKWPQLALGAARQAAQLSDNFAQVHNSLGEVYLREGRPDRAAAAFRRSLAIDPAQPEVRARLAAAR